MSTLFINPIGKNTTLSLFQGGVLLEKYVIESGKDFDTFSEILFSYIQEKEIEQIWVILGPGLFTRMRIITLTLSTLVMSLGVKVKGCHFFELIIGGIPLLQANQEEYITTSENGEIIITQMEDLRPGNYIGYRGENNFTEGKNFIEYTEDWVLTERVFSRLPYVSVLSPIYLKEPHITGSKKNMFLSGEKMKK